MPEDADPPRRFFQLKPKEFEVVNEGLRAAPSAASDAATPGSGSSPASPGSGPIDVRQLAREAMGTAPLLGVNGPVNRPNEVHAMLQGNLSAANASGANDLPPPKPRKSRRRRDYLVLLVPVNAFLAYMAFGPHANAVTFVYGLGGMVLYSTALTWVMYQVMEDY